MKLCTYKTTLIMYLTSTVVILLVMEKLVRAIKLLQLAVVRYNFVYVALNNLNL